MNSKILILSLSLLFLTVLGVKAQTYWTEGTKNICSNNAFPVDLGRDLIETEVSAGGGTWDEVDPTDHSIIIDADVSKLFVAMSRMPGEYHFVFTAKNNPCKPDGEKALVKVVIIENPVSSNEEILLCVGDAPTVELKDYLSPQLSALTMDFIDEGGNTVAGGQFDIPADFEGDINFSYTIKESNYHCETDANLTLVIKRSADVSTLPTDETLTVCNDAMPEKVDLNDILGYNLAGTWASDGATSGATAPAPVGSVVTLKGLVVNSLPATLVYKLTATGSCYSSYTPTVTIKITDALSVDFNNATKDICKTSSPKGYVDLMEILGVQVPQSSGIWKVVNETSPVDVQDGVFELADARVGKYEYMYKVSDAVDLCGLSDQSATVTLNIFDSGEANDGDVQICPASSGDLNLGKYIVGLPTTGVNWFKGTGTSGTAVTGGTVDMSGLDLGTHKYTYSYDAGPCGSTEGFLLVTVSDIVTNFTDKKIKICLTDSGSDAIDLDTRLGVAGVPGTWTFDDSNSDNITDQTAAAISAQLNGSIFDGKATASAETATPNEGTYVFKYTVDSGYSGCVSASEIFITIVMTEEL